MDLVSVMSYKISDSLVACGHLHKLSKNILNLILSGKSRGTLGPEQCFTQPCALLVAAATGDGV